MFFSSFRNVMSKPSERTMFGEKNDADPLANLVDLSARGVHKSVEYPFANANRIYPANRTRRRWPSWNWLFAFVVLGSNVVSKCPGPDDTPGCDSESVRRRVVELANQQSLALTEPALGLMLGAAAQGIAASVASVTNGRMLFYDKDSGFRACVANAAVGRDSAPIGFMIEWQDQEKGKYLVQLSNAAALEVRYGIAATGGSRDQ